MTYTELIAERLEVDMETASKIQNFVNCWFDFRWSGSFKSDIVKVSKEAYAVVEQDRYTAQFVYLPAQFSGPLAQNVTAGYKFASAYRILNDAWVINMRATI